MENNSLSEWSRFVEPDGLMLALMPAHLAKCWQGALDPADDNSNYTKLNDALGFYASVRKLDEDILIVFAGDRMPTSWKVDDRKRLIVLRIQYGEDDPAAYSFAYDRPSLKPIDFIQGIPLINREYRLFDITGPLTDSETNNKIIQLQPGSYQLTTWEATPGCKTGVIVHWLELEHGDKSNRVGDV